MNKVKLFFNRTVALTLLLVGAIKINGFAQKANAIRPGSVWNDNLGCHIQAHGGGITKVKDTYYWYGEDRRLGLDSNKRYVSCYSSKDLMNWRYRGHVVEMTDPDNQGRGWILERPKVFHNQTTKKYVMYFHLDNKSYQTARVGIAVSDRPDGNFTFVKSFRPLGHESRDIGQFVDDDGSAYLIFEDRPFGFRIARLSADYLNVEKEICLIPEHMEGGAIVHYKDRYYVIGSALTGWDPNANKWASAPSLGGPWSQFRDVAPPEMKTYGSQSTLLLKIVGTRNTTILYLGDVWKPKAQWDSRYLWIPVEINDGKLRLPAPGPFNLNVRTGLINN